ncbi:MAG: hypothetical protein V7641_2326 [Blastocatellia bacterium]
MAVTKIEEDKTSSSDEAEANNPSTVSSLVERLRNYLNDWDTDHMARVIHEGAQGYAEKARKASK